MPPLSPLTPEAERGTLAAALVDAGLLDALGTYPDLVHRQLATVIGTEPVQAALVLTDAAVSIDTGMHLEVQVAVLTQTRLVYYRATEGPERDGNEGGGAEPARPNRAALRSQTRVIPLRSILETRITQTAFEPGTRDRACPHADVVSVEVLTAELGSMQMSTETCAECECGTAAHSAEFRQYPVHLIETEETPDKVPHLIAFVAQLTAALAAR